MRTVLTGHVKTSQSLPNEKRRGRQVCVEEIFVVWNYQSRLACKEDMLFQPTIK